MKTSTMIAVGLGVVGVGATAAVVLRKKDEPKPAEPASPTPGIPTIPPIPGLTPGGTIPKPSGPSGLVIVTDAKSVKLQTGTGYRGRLSLSDTDLPPFNPSADAATLAKGISALGFENVKVFMSVAQLPSDWPRETLLGALPNDRFFQGRWTGVSATIPKPWQITSMWVATPEQLAKA